MEMARNSAQTKADASIAKARTQVLALGGSIEVFQNPVVEEATQVLSRKRKARPRRAPSLRRPSTAKTCGARARQTRPRLRRKYQAQGEDTHVPVEVGATGGEGRGTRLQARAHVGRRAWGAAEGGGAQGLHRLAHGPPGGRQEQQQAPSAPGSRQFAAKQWFRLPRPPWRPASGARTRTRARRKMVIRPTTVLQTRSASERPCVRHHSRTTNSEPRRRRASESGSPASNPSPTYHSSQMPLRPTSSSTPSAATSKNLWGQRAEARRQTTTRS